MGRRPIKPQCQGLRDTSMPQPHAPSQHHFLVIGRGLMGTSCACHLAQMGHKVTLIGPDEPQDRQTFQGPFASHHDAGRITRGLAENADWSKLALRSIERYGDFERSVGLSFYHQTGVMMCGPHTGPAAPFSQSFLSVAERMQLDHDVLHGTEISQRFPWFEIPNDNVAAWEKLGGWINPRLLRRAMEQTAIQSGADIVPSWVARQTGTTVTLATGDVITGDHIVVATGGYCATADWCDIRPAMQVYARTVVLAQVSQAQTKTMAAMPSAIILPTGAQLDQDVYILPPIQYPDGQYYIKIGGEESSIVVRRYRYATLVSIRRRPCSGRHVGTPATPSDAPCSVSIHHTRRLCRQFHTNWPALYRNSIRQADAGYRRQWGRRQKLCGNWPIGRINGIGSGYNPPRI